MRACARGRYWAAFAEEKPRQSKRASSALRYLSHAMQLRSSLEALEEEGVARFSSNKVVDIAVLPPLGAVRKPDIIEFLKRLDGRSESLYHVIAQIGESIWQNTNGRYQPTREEIEDCESFTRP